MVVVGNLSLWLLVSRWAGGHYRGFYLTMSWTMLAFLFFVAGYILKERVYRWSGLVLLGVGVVRVTLFDLWRLEAMYRMLSFLALGIVLLVLGFLYPRYQERINRWL